MSESILLDIQGQVATITLNRPDRLNSFNPEMHQALREALDKVESARPAVRVLLLTGAGRGNTLDDQLDLERDLQREAGYSADYKEGVAAFMAKRAPEFVGS